MPLKVKAVCVVFICEIGIPISDIIFQRFSPTFRFPLVLLRWMKADGESCLVGKSSDAGTSTSPKPCVIA
jgi:hypothetical protein